MGGIKTIEGRKKIGIFIKIFLIPFCSVSFVFAQGIKKDSLGKFKDPEFKCASLIVPAVLLGYSTFGVTNDNLKNLDLEITNFVNPGLQNGVYESPTTIYTFEDIFQHAPFLSVYGLSAIGVKGKNNFKDKTVVLTTAYLIMGSTVTGLKNIVSIKRPDNILEDSYPSGHTANAFMGAEFLRQEYKDTSGWYGVTSYLLASVTGVYRIYHNRHRFSEVLAGAGIGILSAKIAYWIHPFVKKKFYREKKKLNGMALPFYNGDQYGLGFALNF